MMAATPSKPYPVYAVVGPSRFLRNEALAGVLGTLVSQMDSSGPSRFTGVEVSPATVLDEVRTQSLLSDRRVVIVDDADPFISANRKTLERYCSAPSKEGSLILLCNALPRNWNLYKIIARIGKVIQVEAPRGQALLRWTVERAKATYRKRLTRSGAEMLVDHLGGEVGLIDAELSKLADYVGTRDEIAPADIDVLTGHLREEKIFAVMDAIGSGDASGALRQWEHVMATDRAAPGRAIAGLAWSVRSLLDARRAWESGLDLGALAGRMRTNPALLRRRLERVTIARLQAWQQDLLAADMAIKTGATTIGPALERFIIKHSLCGSTAPKSGAGNR